MEDIYTSQYGQFLEKKAHTQIKGNFSSSASHNTSVTIAAHNVRKLPAFPIRKFSEDYRDWISFKNLFTALMINSNRTLAEKLSYLKNALIVEPLF